MSQALTQWLMIGSLLKPSGLNNDLRFQFVFESRTYKGVTCSPMACLRGSINGSNDCGNPKAHLVVLCDLFKQAQSKRSEWKERLRAWFESCKCNNKCKAVGLGCPVWGVNTFTIVFKYACYGAKIEGKQTTSRDMQDFPLRDPQMAIHVHRQYSNAQSNVKNKHFSREPTCMHADMSSLVCNV